MEKNVMLPRTYLIFLLFCTNMLNVYVTSTCNSTSSFWFKRYASRDKGITLVGQSWTDKSATSCGIKAAMKYPELRSFMYNVRTKECHPGGAVSATGRFPRQEESLYFNSGCQSSKGFHFISYNKTKACIGVFNETLSYTEAINACKEKQSFLISIKSRDKLEILRNEVSSTYSHSWIGLDDQVTEGNYIWAEDLTSLNSSWKGQIFRPGEPNDALGNEDCVEYVSSSRLLNDENCLRTFPYVCEQTVM